ncbi:MAG: hypothetical protein KDA24_09215 [Deltaproteobacteria bacterium]|nr:hypothetical protein [Deltaproteobacteria bacterium]
MNRIITLTIIALSLLTAAPAMAAPPKSDMELGRLMTLQNELYAEARVTRDQMSALHEEGRLGTDDGQARMEQLQAHLTLIEIQVTAVRQKRQVIVAAKKSQRLRNSARVVVARERAPSSAVSIKNASR